jgi:hypothetical protein
MGKIKKPEIPIEFPPPDKQKEIIPVIEPEAPPTIVPEEIPDIIPQEEPIKPPPEEMPPIS